MSDSHVEDLLDLYALGALEPDEVHAVEVHMETCARCAGMAAEATRVTQLLAWAPEQRTPPADLQAKIRRRVEGLAALERPRELANQSFSAASLTPKRAEYHPRWRLPAPWIRVALTLGMLLLLALGGWNVVLWQRLGMLQGEVARQQEVAALLRAPGARVVTMAPQPAAPSARGNLIIDPAGTEAVLIAAGLPTLPDNQAYQLWLAEGQARTSAAVFQSDAEGATTLLVRSPKPLHSYTGCGITIEPAGGSPQPTGERVLRAEMAQPEGGWTSPW
jgi:anti-sigma-K factor RskA